MTTKLTPGSTEHFARYMQLRQLCFDKRNLRDAALAHDHHILAQEAGDALGAAERALAAEFPELEDH